MITHGELFAGIGGFGLGADNAGMKTLWHVEIDKSAQTVLRHHWPDVQLESDVCQVGKHNLQPVDVISFGSPCQDLSIAGKRKGLENGTRSSLFFEAIRIVRELSPKVAIWENVPGALSSNGGQDFRAVLSEMLRADVPMPRSGRWATAGMVRSGEVEVAWRILDAQYFGVAQRRRRIFVVASFGGQCAAEILFEQGGVRRDTPPGREQGQEITGTLRVRTFASRNQPEGVVTFARQRTDEYKESDVVSTISQRDCKSATDLIAFQPGNLIRKGGANPSEYVFPTLGSSTLGDQFPHIAWEMQHASEAYRETAGGIAPTLQSRMGTCGNNVPLVGIRRLTPLECERLQGFPDGWTDGQSDSARYKQLGNAVAVPVVEWICKRIAAA